MKVAVVTGANGFIGAAVTKELLKLDYKVYAIVTDANALLDLECQNLTVIKAFFEEYQEIPNEIKEPVDVFYHFAWQGVWGKPFSDYSLQMKNAVNAGMAMEIAQKVKAKKFILASTVNVLEIISIINGKQMKKMRATANYAMAKLSAEMICRTLTNNNETDFNCAYIAMTYGPGNFSLMVPNVVMGELIANESPDLIEGNGLYDLIYIDDVARGFVAIGEKGKPMTSYYLGHSNLKTFKQLFTEIGEIINPQIKLNFGAYKDDNQIDYFLVDVKALEKDTGFSPSSDFKKSITITSEWIKQNDILGRNKK